MEELIIEAYQAWFWRELFRVVAIDALMCVAFATYYLGKDESLKESAFVSGCALGVLGVVYSLGLIAASHWPKAQAVKFLVGAE